MVPKRVRLAGVLDRMGLMHVLLRARAWALLPGRRLTVLTFHRVARPGAPGFDPEVTDTTPEAFDRQLAILKQYFTLIDTRDLEAHRQGERLPDNPAMITFDDGYRDNHDQALPILQRHGAKAVFFVASAYVDERRLFWWERVAYLVARSPRARLRLVYPEPLELPIDTADARRAARRRLLSLLKEERGIDLERFLEDLGAAAGVVLPRPEERALADQLVMTWDHARALRAAGMDVQSHTHRHRIMQTMTPEEVRADLAASRRLLEAQVGGAVRAVAYPAGRPLADETMREAVREAGFTIGLTSGTGAARLDGSVDWLSLPRVAVVPEMPEPFFRGCLAIPRLAW